MQQLSCGLARALPGVAQYQQLDGIQPQAEPLGAAAELQPVQRPLVVTAVVPAVRAGAGSSPVRS